MNNREISFFLIVAIPLGIITVGIGTYLEDLFLQESWITVLIVSVFYGLPMLYWLKLINKNHVVSNRQIIGFLVLLLALPIFAYAYFGTQIPETSLSASYTESLGVGGNGNLTASYTVIYHFSTVGSFSVENPVHVRVSVVDCNVTNFTNYIGVVGFTGALAYPIQTNYQGAPISALLPLKQVSDRELSAEGNMIWYQSVSTYDVWLPPLTTSFNQDYWQGWGDSILTISPISDKLTIDNNQTLEQLTYVLVGFSVLMTYPIFVEFFPTKTSPVLPDTQSENKDRLKSKKAQSAR